ncbi:hypothetical protein ABT299_20145 [Spirillospora sp. NPDC000708]
MNDMFGKVQQDYSGTVGFTQSRLSLDSRMLLIAMSRADNAGHALFEEGELRYLLAKPTSDGSRKPVSRATVFNNLKKLRESGLLLPGGGERCLWLPREFWSRGKVSQSQEWCPVHHTRKPGSVSNVIQTPDGSIFHGGSGEGDSWWASPDPDSLVP